MFQTSIMSDDLAYRSLCAFVRWHLDNDATELSPELKEETFGRFLNLPFATWLNESRLEGDVEEWSRLGFQPSEDLLSCLGARFMPPSLLDRLLGPHQPHLPLPFQRGACIWGEEYEVLRLTMEQREDPEVIKLALKGIIPVCIQWFFYYYLCERHELISAFQHPASTGLSDKSKLAIGIMREVIIIPRFGSMRYFWLHHAQMMKEGGRFLGFVGRKPFGEKQIKEILSDSPDDVTMLEVALAMGMSKTDFVGCYGALPIYFKGHEDDRWV